MTVFHGPGNTFPEIHTLGKNFFKGKIRYGMAGRTGSQGKCIKLFFLFIPNDLLPGFLAAEEGMYSTMGDKGGCFGYGLKPGNLDGMADLAAAADINPGIFGFPCHL
jgi:hypothetical protein